MNATKPAAKGMVFALGIICIILAACLAGVIMVYAFVISGKNSTISSLDTQISQLNSNVTNLQNQLDSLLNGSSSTGEIIMSNPSLWVNSTVTVEGSLSGVLAFPAFESCPWNEVLSSGNLTIGVSTSNSANTTLWNQSDPYVRIQGLMKKGEITYTGNIIPPEVTYYVEAEVIESI
jgi:outer membrane murein-binding lipoprotein Lpp